MRIGCIGYANNTGLGNYIANFRKHLPLSSQLVIRHPDKGTQQLDIPYTVGSITATEQELIEYLDTHSPDIVIVVEEIFNDAFFGIMKERGIKIVYVPMIDCKSVDVIKPFSEYIDVIINHTLCGHDIYEAVLGEGKSVYLPYPVDTDYFIPSTDAPEFTFIHNQGTGGAGYRKSTDQVFIAFRQMSYEYPDATLLVNSQPYEHIHSQLFKDVKNATVKVQDFPEAIDIYRNGQVYIAPSRREGLGLPILEAMSCGLPVITTDAIPMNEWFKDNTLLVSIVTEKALPYGDVPMYTPNTFDLMQKMIYAHQHPKHMGRIGEANREIIVKNCSWTVLKDKYIELFESL